ncbi:NigD-like protein [uncultured Bacteroides sp.]|uniref:NigD-like protein n=1 Tax=uncultured Bacteroides sp. TaxID=162156 RepID=UPI0026308097|nr:NigD-like protein [uncultured Bacteroides sp.]
MKLINYCLAAFLLSVAALFTSCNDDEGYSIGDIGIDCVTVHVENDGLYTFTGDTWGTMFPAATSIFGYFPVEGERAILVFNPLYDNYGGYDVGIKVERIYPLLTKTVENLTEENEAEYGNDPAYMENIWISGGYMNLVFRQKLPSKNKHRVSLVRNQADPAIADDGYIHLEYRYNTYGDTLNTVVKGMVCYNLNTLPLDNAKGIKLSVNDAHKGKCTIVFNKLDEEMPENVKQTFSQDEVLIK